ncbi:MAG: hypothetical protein V4436_00760 [Patescibacteria group bacterium]
MFGLTIGILSAPGVVYLNLLGLLLASSVIAGIIECRRSLAE